MKKSTFLLALIIFSLLITSPQFAQTHFGPQTLINPVSMSDPVELQWADLDGDGDDDCLVVSHWDDTISWFENLGNGEFGPQHLITEDSGRAEAIAAADLDGDGDIDVVSGERSTQKVHWFMNLNGLGNFSDPIAISYEMPVDDILVDDMNQDGLPDIVAAFASTISWFQNLGEGLFGEATVITEYTANFIRSIQTADINQDDRPDILFCASDSHLVGWIENTGTRNRFGAIQEITIGLNYPVDVFPADLDGDGDMDVLSASSQDDEINWFENQDGQGTFGPKNNLTTIANSASSVYAGDFDMDGDMDVLSTGFYQILYFENLDGQGNFGQINYVTAIAQGAKSGKIQDIDGDGYPDISAVYSQSGQAVWIPQNPDQPGFGQVKNIAKMDGTYPLDIFFDNIDTTLKGDIVTAFSGDNKIMYYGFGADRDDTPTVSVIDDDISYPYSVWAADLNGDKLKDILYASLYDASLHWKPNLDGGNFGERVLVSDQLDYRSKVRTLDQDQDGDQDLIFSWGLNGELAILPNLDGTGNFGPPMIFEKLPPLISTFIMADQDHNDSFELLVVANGNRSLLSIDPYPDPAVAEPITVFESNEEINAIASGDIDEDSFEEIVFATDLAIYMIENGEGRYEDVVQISNEIQGIVSLALDDLDLDGDQDLVVCSEATDKVYWFENNGDIGQPVGPKPLDDSTVFPVKVLTGDVNGDGYPDILSASSWDDKIAWYKNRQLLNITLQPEDQEICEYEDVAFSVDTDRDAEFQWQLKRFSDHFFSDIKEEYPFTGTSGKQLNLDSVGYYEWQWAQFRCKIIYEGDSLFTDAASLTIVPTITAYAGYDQYLCDSLFVLLEADDAWPGTGIWTCSDPNVTIIEPGYSISPVSGLPYGTTEFYWEVSHELCPGDADTVQLTLYEPVMLMTEPFDQELVLGETAQFIVETSGEVFRYQWFKNWEILQNNEQINGVNGPVLTVKEVTMDNEGTYYCTIYGRCDTLESERAELSITTSIDRIHSATLWIGPNPIQQPADLIFHIPGIHPDAIICYDEKGRIVEDFWLEKSGTNKDRYLWSIQNLPPGVYYVCFRKADKTVVKKLLIL
jgi:hypothetical protein